MENTQNTQTKSIIGFLVFLGVAAGVVALALNDKKDETPAITRDESATSTETVVATTSTTIVGTSSTTTTASAITAYKNGTYSATGTYKSPAGIERVNLSVVIENDIVTEATFKGLAENTRSIGYQEQFTNGYRPLVIGKNINSISLTKVSGSSLTSTGFNDALGKIKDEAERM